MFGITKYKPKILVLVFAVWDFVRNVTSANSEGNLYWIIWKWSFFDAHYYFLTICRCWTRSVTCTRWAWSIGTWSRKTCCTTVPTRTLKSWSAISDSQKWKIRASWRQPAGLQVQSREQGFFNWSPWVQRSSEAGLRVVRVPKLLHCMVKGGISDFSTFKIFWSPTQNYFFKKLLNKHKSPVATSFLAYWYHKQFY